MRVAVSPIPASLSLKFALSWTSTRAATGAGTGCEELGHTDLRDLSSSFQFARSARESRNREKCILQAPDDFSLMHHQRGLGEVLLGLRQRSFKTITKHSSKQKHSSSLRAQGSASCPFWIAEYGESMQSFFKKAEGQTNLANPR